MTRLQILALASASALFLAFCGGGTTAKKSTGDDAPDAANDGGAGSAECLTSDDCKIGDCVNLHCVACTITPCPQGSECGPNGKCVANAGSDGGSADVGGSGCTSRKECTNNLVCKGGACVAEDPSGNCVTTNECAPGRICNFSTCIAGCESKTDCVGNSAGPRCDPSTNQCGPCASSSDCGTGEVCSSGTCAMPKSCTDVTNCGGLACINGFCKDCAIPSDCGVGYGCTNGQCQKLNGCTDDTQCHGISPGHFCNKSSGQCEWGCLAGTGAACGSNCCTGGQTCNGVTHQCEGGCNNCNNSCTGGQVCDTNTCMCVGNTGGPDAGTIGGLPDGGGIGTLDPCDSNCGCPGGGTCTCPFGGCNPLACSFGLGICL